MGVMNAQTDQVRSDWASLKGMESVALRAIGRPIAGAVMVPGSKSVTNRALIMAGFARGVSVIRGALRSDDSYWCLDALRKLGIAIVDDGQTLTVTGLPNPITPAEPLFIGSAGTTARFLTSIAAFATKVPLTITASDQLSARPMRLLFEALETLGGRFEFGVGHGQFPVTVLPRGAGADQVTMSGAISSQFISGVLMAAPLLDRAITLRISDAIVQEDYVRITLAMLKDFGIAIDVTPGFDQFIIHPGQYQPVDYIIEADASTASYFLALAAVTGGSITLNNLPAQTFQPDIKFIDVLERMGCVVTRRGDATTLQGPIKLRGGFSVDMQACSDTALTLAAIAPYADGPIEITNIEHIRKHECDRVSVMAQSLRALGVPVDERKDGWRIEPALPNYARLKTHDDHRIAMSLAVLGVAGSGVELTDPACVSKTCPGFFEMIGGLGVEMEFQDKTPS
jgi:3-phosphoshikimate 1-carboxyvinyltransferase